MRPELERLFMIEQQLLQGPAAVPAADWQLRLLLDGDLQADSAIQQKLYTGLQAAGRRQLRREVAAIHQRLYEPGPSRWARPLHHLMGWLRGLK